MAAACLYVVLYVTDFDLCWLLVVWKYVWYIDRFILREREREVVYSLYVLTMPCVHILEDAFLSGTCVYIVTYYSPRLWCAFFLSCFVLRLLFLSFVPLFFLSLLSFFLSTFRSVIASLFSSFFPGSFLSFLFYLQIAVRLMGAYPTILFYWYSFSHYGTRLQEKEDEADDVENTNYSIASRFLHLLHSHQKASSSSSSQASTVSCFFFFFFLLSFFFGLLALIHGVYVGRKKGLFLCVKGLLFWFCLSLSRSLSICLSASPLCLSLSICLSICVSIHICLSICIWLATSFSICLFAYNLRRDRVS